MLSAKLKEQLSRRGIGISAVISLFLVALGLFLISSGLSLMRNTDEDSALPENVIEPEETGYSLSESAPLRLRIPKLNIDAPFVELGLDANNEIEVPKGYDEAGWYKYGPTPGELGPAVVLGHVDSYLGPAVFFYLGQLDPGDIIEIEREDGSVATFRVDKIERYPQSDFPIELVYGNINYAGLRLITCSGAYDREEGSYDTNLVVYASLIEPD